MKRLALDVLLISSDCDYAGQLRAILSERFHSECEVMRTESVAEATEKLSGGGINLILFDLSTPGLGLDQVETLQNAAPLLPIIVLSGLEDENLASEAMRSGVQDYIVKRLGDDQLLVRSIRYSIERKQSEVAVMQAEEKYRSIFENTAEGIFQTTPDGHYLSANRALARIYGYGSPDELIAKLTDIQGQLYVEPGRRDEFIRLMQEHQAVTNFESRVYRKDRSIIWIAENVRVVRDKQGQVRFYEGTVEDITERKLAEERLRDSENLYHSLVENLPQNIFRKDLSERFTFANQRFCLTLGRPLEEILGKTDFDFFPPELAAKYQQDDRVILETGKIFEAVEEHQPPHGEKIYVNVVKTPLHDSQGQIVGLQGIFWDITERKRAEERVRRANAELARSREELRVKNAQLEEDLRMAREIQLAILPQQYPTFPGDIDPARSALQFCHRYLPTEVVGGDFFNVLAISDTKAGVFICDVMGHGVRSALVTAIMRALVEELTQVASDPGQLLAQINRDLRIILKQTGTPMFTTAFYMVVDLEKRQIHFANAGHPKPFLIQRSTRRIIPLRNSDGKSRPALGLFDDSVYPASDHDLGPSDMVMLFTDGLYDIEGADEQSFSPEWLQGEVGKRMDLSAAELFDELLDSIRKRSPNGQFADDVCLVGMEVASTL